MLLATKPLKLTEDEVVLALKGHLEKQQWYIGERYCLGAKWGYDIEASKDGRVLIVEAKGARASDTAPTKKRPHFDGGQIKTHFGKALVKILEEKVRHRQYEFAIAHPDDKDIRRIVEPLLPFLKQLHIKHYWVTSENIVEAL
jgi:hypothetical protein